jgi:hypothetical protein
MFGPQVTREDITKAIDQLWTLHDEAQDMGDEIKANKFSKEAFQLLELLPENQIYLRIKQ